MLAQDTTRLKQTFESTLPACKTCLLSYQHVSFPTSPPIHPCICTLCSMFLTFSTVIITLNVCLCLFCPLHVFYLLGIMCMDRLDDIVKLVGSNAVGNKEGRLVVQKYIGTVWLKNALEISKDLQRATIASLGSLRILLCCYRKYLYPSHRGFFGLTTPSPSLWKFQFWFILSFKNFDF